MSEQLLPIFDGHNDTVLSLRKTGRSFFERSSEGHIDLPRATSGGLAGGFFAVWAPDPGVHIEPDDPNATTSAYDDVGSMPPMMETPYAQNYALGSFARLLRLEKESAGAIQIIRTASDLRDCLATGAFAMELHVEGAEPIDDELTALEVFHAAGLRSLGIVWSRTNIFAHGVPFQFGSTPDTGPGLTEAGKNLVRGCNQLGVLLDLSHINEKGFWDVARLTEAPLVATHSCAHALCPATRNLTDRQLDAVRDSGGVVGVNFHVGFLHPEGNNAAAATGVARIVDHADYMVQRMGIEHVALGSDFDGATMPGDLVDVAGLPTLVAEFRRRGYDDTSLAKIATGNWLRVFEATWGA